MTELVGKRLGEFEVVRELGRGGMGVVYEARQVTLNRRVALKVLAPGLGLTPRGVDRFRREAEAAAKLHHTNIVPVYATGAENGLHFYAMELIDGPSLDRVIVALRAGLGADDTAAPLVTPALPPELIATGPYHDPTPAAGDAAPGLSSGGGYFDAVARAIAAVAEALHHAHRNNLIHRDVKPGNLLLGPDGRLCVNDFGLARALEEPGVTATGELVGTPAYMAPEQIAGGRIPVDHRCDIYSLGATLYELLTLRPPFTADRRDELLAQVTQKGPTAPRRVNPRVPRDLETICLKCLEKDPDRRYPTAQALADDLRRYLGRFAIAARRPGPLTKLGKWVKRNPVLTAAGVAVVLALGAAGGFAWRAVEAERLRAEEKRRQDETALAEKRRAVLDRGMVAAFAADLTTARAAVTEAEQLGSPPGELHLLRGFVALYSGDAPGAVSAFRTATELMPESVSAHALLAAALVQTLAWAEADRALKEALRLPVRSPEDRLFLGLALSQADSAGALRELRAAVRERPSNIGHVLMADALWVHASNSGTVPDADDALYAAETALRLLPTNPAVQVIGVNARLAAAYAYTRAGRFVEARTHLDTAERLAESFSAPPGNFPAFYARFLLATARDGPNRPPLPQTARLALPAGPTAHELRELYAIGLYRRNELDQARAVEMPAVPSVYSTELKMLLALERPDGRTEAGRAWAAHIEPQFDPVHLMDLMPWLYLTGEGARVPQLAARLRASGFRYSVTPAADWDLVLRFWEGKLTERELLDAPATDRPQRSWRYFIVGLKRLGAGDREGAREALTVTYEAGCFAYTPWEWSCTFLIRLNTDPQWPKAIPAKRP
jgi:serine/threonine protein kinase/Flp pilus assembly protein TadD